jgi:alkylhydroperoxidase family enzyme
MRRFLSLPYPISRLLGRSDHPALAPSDPDGALPAYVALGHWAPPRATLDIKLELLIAQLSAELSACQWCIAQSRHRWLKAFLPADLLAQVRTYETSVAFTERERAALALAEAVARHSDVDRTVTEPALERARRHFAEAEVARVAAAAAGEHFFNPATGAIGRDAMPVTLAADGTTPWHAIDRGVAIRGLY